MGRAARQDFPRPTELSVARVRASSPALTFSLCTTASNDDIRILHSPRRSSCARTGPGSPRPPTCTFRVSGSLAFWSPPSYPLPEYERAARQDFPRPNRKLLQHTEPVAFPRRATYTSTDRSLCRCHLRYCARAWSPSLSRVPLPCLLKPKAFNAYLDCVIRIGSGTRECRLRFVCGDEGDANFGDGFLDSAAVRFRGLPGALILCTDGGVRQYVHIREILPRYPFVMCMI